MLVEVPDRDCRLQPAKIMGDSISLAQAKVEKRVGQSATEVQTLEDLEWLIDTGCGHDLIW